MNPKYMPWARAALDQYGLVGADLSYLSDSDNIVFRVSAPSGLFALRLQKPGRLNQNQILVELNWLRHLRRDAGLAVPEPLAGPNGALLQTVQLATDGPPHCCVLFRWVEGQCRELDLAKAEVAQVGRLMARLHQHAAEFSRLLPQNRKAYCGDPDSWIHRPGSGAEATYSPPELALLAQVATRVCNQIPTLGETAESFGLIHADLNPWNLLVHNGQVRAIDFYDCGWGHYLHDMAIFLSDLNISARADFAKLQTVFLEAYEQVTPLPPGWAEYLDLFIARRILQLLKWILEWPRPDLRPFGQPYLRAALQQLDTLN